MALLVLEIVVSVKPFTSKNPLNDTILSRNVRLTLLEKKTPQFDRKIRTWLLLVGQEQEDLSALHQTKSDSA